MIVDRTYICRYHFFIIRTITFFVSKGIGGHCGKKENNYR